MKLHPAGDRGLLAELGSVTAAELHAAARRAGALTGLLACIPGHASLYLVFERLPDVREVESVLGESLRFAPDEGRVPAVAAHRIPVCFDGTDLPELLSRVSREEFLERVARLRLTVRYLGFRGGFGYLDGWPEEWAMARRPTSRPHVPRGTFGVAGSVAGFYPIDSPGGWNLLGRTTEELEHALHPGEVIGIDPVDQLPAAPPASPRRHAHDDPFVEIVAGPLVREVAAADWGGIVRGIPPGGPFDDVAAALAQRAVRGGGAIYECAVAGPRVRAKRDCAVAWCGPDLRVSVQALRAGEEHAFGRVTGGLRGYVATGEERGLVMSATRSYRLHVAAMAGPHESAPGEVTCEVTPRLDRVGIRLRPLTALRVEAPADLRSVGMQCGTVQLHPDGTLVAMGPDHPVTGGYLQPFTVLSSERWKLAQLVPGEKVTFAIAAARTIL